MGVLKFVAASSTKVESTSLSAALANVSDGAWTAAVLMKRTVDNAAYHGLSYLYTGTGAGVTRAGFSLTDADLMYVDVGAGSSVGGLAVTGTTETYLLVTTKPAGSSLPRFHRYNKTTNTWATPANATSSIPDQVAATSLRVGVWQAADFADAWIGLVGWWEGAMSDANVQSLSTDWKTSTWHNSAHGTPKSLIELNTATPTDLEGGASSLAVTAATVDNTQTLEAWNFNGTGAGATFSKSGLAIIGP